MHHSLTWQTLLPWILDLLMEQVISQVEAAELQDLCLTSLDEWVVPPPSLKPVVHRINLYRMPASPTLH